MNDLVLKIRIEGLAELAELANAMLTLAGKLPGEAAVIPPIADPMQVQANVIRENTPPIQSQVPMSYQQPAQQMPQVPQLPAGGYFNQQAPQQMPVQQMPVQQQQPAQMPPQQPPIPTTAVSHEYTQDQLAIAASGLVNMGKQQRLIEILHGFGVSSLMELKKEDYGAFAGAIKVEGAVLNG